MNYELAKQLKDAEFPMGEWVYKPDGAREPWFPTLSELIEACGKEFETLSWYEYPNKWMVTGGTDEIKEYIGSTPEEAVAKLWLALNS